ncbi:MAG TPA: hypothetical protein PKC49_08730, partial [Phycisphaerae bacterium]|nr:hypothetical protein [Phycisphaerae bacterium]
MNRLFVFAHVVVSASVCSAVPGGEHERVPPDALLRFERARAALQSGVVECSRETRGVDTAGGGGEFRLFTYATARFGLQDAIWLHRGDAEGVTLRDEAGNPAATSPLARLRAGGRVWEDERGAGMRVSCFTPGAGRVPDARTFGVGAAMSQLDLAQALWKDADAGGRTYRETVRDGLHIVTADAAGESIEWWIDPSRGWNAVRVVTRRQGHVAVEARIALRQFDEVWFPEAIEFFRSGWKGGKEPCEVLRVYSAEFNSPDHPLEFKPEDIGITPGTFVVQLDAQRREAGYGSYDGNEFLTFAERRARAEAAKAASGGAEPAGRSAAERYAAALRAETEWEAYTRRFIERYRFIDEQAEQAWRICRTCQDSALDYARRHEQPLAQLREQLSRQAAEPDGRRRAQAALDARLLSIANRVQDIFDNQLKPRLEKLPTREQRRAVEQRER